MRWCDDGVLVLSSVAPSLVLYSVAPTHCLTLTIHCLTHHLSLTHHSRQSIGCSISLSLKLLHSLIYTRYPSSYHSHGVLLSPSVLSQLVLSFTFIPHPQVFSLSVLSHSRSPNHPTSHHSFHQSLSHGVHYLCSHRYPSYTSHLTWCPTTHRVIPDLLTLIECSLTLHGVVLPPTHSHSLSLHVLILTE